MKADLVLEGGGVKGIGLVGAISVLEEHGYEFGRVAGTSAGAIVGALVASGMPAAELLDVMRSLDYTRFRDKGLAERFGPVGAIVSLLAEKGVYEGDFARTWLDDQLARRGTRTFGDLRLDDAGADLAAERAHRLVVMASDVSQGSLRRLPWDYGCYGLDPDAVPVADAVRASMSIPFYYEPVKLRDVTTGHDSYLVDGGMLSNFPVDVFDRGDGAEPRWPTFGIKLSARAVPGEGAGRDVHGPVSLAMAMVSTMTGFHDQLHLDEPHVLARTMFVDTTGVRATDFDIDAAAQDRLFDSGRDAARRFLEGTPDYPAWDFEAYKKQFRTA